jgi:hypothetical protein
MNWVTGPSRWAPIWEVGRQSPLAKLRRNRGACVKSYRAGPHNPAHQAAIWEVGRQPPLATAPLYLRQFNDPRASEFPPDRAIGRELN